VPRPRPTARLPHVVVLPARLFERGHHPAAGAAEKEDADGSTADAFDRR
jgi:hypothetical protein